MLGKRGRRIRKEVLREGVNIYFIGRVSIFRFLAISIIFLSNVNSFEFSFLVSARYSASYIVVCVFMAISHASIAISLVS